MPTLTDEIKTFIVKGLARYDTPSQVAEAVKATFDVEVSRQQVYAYDPNCAQPPAMRWRALHAATRRAFIDDVAEVGIANRTTRLKMLDQMARRAEASGNVRLVAALLEQAAKEVGGMYKRRRHLSAVALAKADPFPSAPSQRSTDFSNPDRTFTSETSSATATERQPR